VQADYFYQLLRNNDFGPFTGVPCSLVKDLIIQIEHSSDSDYFIATSEGEAMGLAGGFALAGRKPVVIMQNDGFGNTINPLSSLQLLYLLPALLLITWRAEPGGKPDAPQHRIMGDKLLDLLRTLDIPHTILEDDQQHCQEAMATAREYLDHQHKPYAFIIRRGLFEPEKRATSGTETSQSLRIDYIRLLAEKVHDRDVILGTTGYTGRELIGSLGLALAMDQADRRIYVLDGDGALLMKLGTLATIGLYHPANLIHIVFDNGQYESTGGQATASRVVNFPALAANAGYTFTISTDSLDGFRSFLEQAVNEPGPSLCHVRVQPGTLIDLQRPAQTPEQLRQEFEDFISS
jgi:phosphonopyruvate decarboxylase